MGPRLDRCTRCGETLNRGLPGQMSKREAKLGCRNFVPVGVLLKPGRAEVDHAAYLQWRNLSVAIAPLHLT